MLPEKIKKLRKKLNITQQRLADLIGVSQITVARWETSSQYGNRPKGAGFKALADLAAKANKRGNGQR